MELIVAFDSPLGIKLFPSEKDRVAQTLSLQDGGQRCIVAQLIKPIEITIVEKAKLDKRHRQNIKTMG